MYSTACKRAVAYAAHARARVMPAAPVRRFASVPDAELPKNCAPALSVVLKNKPALLGPVLSIVNPHLVALERALAAANAAVVAKDGALAAFRSERDSKIALLESSLKSAKGQYLQSVHKLHCRGVIEELEHLLRARYPPVQTVGRRELWTELLDRDGRGQLHDEEWGAGMLKQFAACLNKSDELVVALRNGDMGRVKAIIESIASIVCDLHSHLSTDVHRVRYESMGLILASVSDQDVVERSKNTADMMLAVPIFGLSHEYECLVKHMCDRYKVGWVVLN